MRVVDQTGLKIGRRATFKAAICALASFVAGSCNSATEPRPAESFVIRPSAQWSGGEIVIDLEPRLDSASVEAVLAGDDSLVFTFDSQELIIALLPADINGIHDVTIKTPGRSIHVGQIDVFGFEASEILTPRLVRGLRDWTASFGAAVMGPTDAGLGILYLTTSSGVTFDGIHNPSSLYSPGQAADPMEVYARQSSRDTIVQWRLTTAVPATPLDTFYAPTLAYWSIARLGPDLWLWGSHHELRAVKGPASDGSFSLVERIQAEETLDYEFLPTLNRVALSGTLYGGGVPVFDMASGQLAYRIEEIDSSYALFAVPSLDEFIVAGRGTGTWDDSPYRLSVVDGLSGSTKLSRAIESLSVNAEFDHERGLIFVAGYPEGFVDIYERATLERVGRMEGPPVGAWDTELALDADNLYAVFGNSAAEGTIVYNFRLLPLP